MAPSGRALSVAAVLAASFGALRVPMPSEFTGQTPAWPLYRAGVALNDFLEATTRALRPPEVHVKLLATAYWKSEVTFSLVSSGVIDLVGEQTAASCSDVAEHLALNEDFLCRVMAAGEQLGLLQRRSGAYSLTLAGELLQQSHPQSLRAAVLFMDGGETREAWHIGVTESLKTGRAGFREGFGADFFDWANRAENSAQRRIFGEAMTALSSDQIRAIAADWVPPHADAVVCDVGGGVGHLIGALAQKHPSLRGLVFDQPTVVPRTRQNLAALGVDDRVGVVGGSFFEAFPEELRQCDAFLLKYILHDWSDEACVGILGNIAAVAKRGAVISSVDAILGTDGPYMEMMKHLSDVSIMTLLPGGRERSFADYAELFRRANITSAPKLIKLREVLSVVQTSL